MPRTSDKRERLIRTAQECIHRQGFNRTTLADIAQEADVPLGNVYYYFKTKEAIGEAVVERRRDEYAQAIQAWEARYAQPSERLKAFVAMTLENREVLVDRGCPIGSLCTELQKEGGAFADRASAIFQEILAWLQEQFAQLGKGRESRRSAITLLSALEGATLLSHALRSPEFVRAEARRLMRWIDTL